MDSLQLVSVIIPTFKTNNSLIRAVSSVLNQTYTNIEVIVVDDNDPDTVYRSRAKSIMERFLDDKRVKYLCHERNKNGSAARNTGVKHSRGEFICFLDDDDLYMRDKVSKQVAYLLMNPQHQAVYCWRYHNGDIIINTKIGDLSKEILSLSFTPYTSSLMIRRECYEALGGFDENFRRHQDFEFLLRFFEKFSIGVVEEPLVEIIGNEVNNALECEELEKLKKQFLIQFEMHIDRIDKKEPGFRKMVFARHYSLVFWSYIKHARFLSGLRVFLAYSKISGSLTFLICVGAYLKKYVKTKRKKYVQKYKNKNGCVFL